MFLLGRGRAVTLRLKNPPRVRWVSQSLVCRGNNATTWKKPQDAKDKKRKGAVERDAQGRPIVKAREKSLGAFRPLPVASLTHELFEPENEEDLGRVELDLPEMQPRLLTPGVVTSFHYTDPTSPLRVFGVPKKMVVEFRILGVPCSVTTSTTLSIIRALEESVSVPSRLVLNGRAGCGKSFLLLQAAEYAAATQEWFVLYVPRAQRFVDGSTSYAYSLRTRTYLQLRAARETLRRLGRANAHILDHLHTTEAITLESGEILPEGTPLLDVVRAGQGEEGEPNAHACLEALLDEMGRQTVFPVLIAIDDFQALTGRSLYRDPHGRFIRPHHLGIPRLLLEYASGRKQLARGCVLGALSRTDTQFPVTPQLSASLGLPADFAPSPRMAGVGKMGGSGRWNSQLAQYLDNEIEVKEPALVEEEYDEAENIAANEQLETNDGDVEADAVAEQPPSDTEPAVAAVSYSESEMKNPWTGWRVYDPPIYEDTYQARPANPEPKPKRVDEWKQRVMRDEEDVVLESSVSEEADVEGEAELSPMRSDPKREGGELGEGGKKTVRALRAIRVPDALSIREAAALFEVWLDTGLLRTGNERRALRRAEIETLEGYREIKAVVDKVIPYPDDPVVADADYAEFISSVPADALQTKSETSSSWKTEAPKTEAPKTATVADSEGPGETLSWRESLKAFAESYVLPEHSEDDELISGVEFLARRRMGLANKEYTGVTALEEALEGETWLNAADDADNHISSLDQEIDRDPREQEVSDEDIAEEDLLEEADDIGLPEEHEFEFDATEPEGTMESDQEESKPGEGHALNFGSDPEIAKLLSDELLYALLDPQPITELRREPTLDDLPVEQETGADDLFLGKYAESQGNARAFVWGGLLATLQTSG